MAARGEWSVPYPAGTGQSILGRYRHKVFWCYANLFSWVNFNRSLVPHPYPHFLVTWLANLASCEACCDLVMYSKRTGWHRKLSCKERQLRVLNFCKQRKRNTTNYVCGCVTGLGDLWRSRKLIIFFYFVLLFERKKIFEKLWGLNNDFRRELYCWDRWRCLKF